MSDDVLRVLHVEDDPVDRELVAATLRGDGLDVRIDAVDTREGMLGALAAGSYDVILADDRLPAFDGQAAQTLAAERAPLVPFIFVSGTLGEEIAVERLKTGAFDYVLKQRLGRLPKAIRRAIQEAHTRAEHAQAEEKVRRLNADLEQRVNERTAQLADREEALRASEQRLQSILDHSPALIYVKGLDGRYQFANRAFARMLNRDQADVVGRTDYELFAPRLADIYRANDAEALRIGKATYVEEPLVVLGETVRVYSSAKFPLLGRDDRPYALCGISTDITQRKHADDEIKTARLEAERANRAKSDFLSRMSHDLRTPLNAVLGFAQLLAVDATTPEQLEGAQQIQSGGQHLLALIDEVLDIARIEAGHLSLSPEPVSVHDIVTHTTALVAPLGRERGITITIEQSPLISQSVHADRQRLNQVLLNLLSNAVKYNRTGGRVTVSFEQRGTRLRLRVSDTGAGIPVEKQRLLFRPFERLGAELTAVQGTGLGLTLVRGLAEAMGGSVGFESVTDQGSMFWIELQIVDAQPGRILVNPDLSPLHVDAGRAATVLYIEDNLSNVRLMQRLLMRRPAVTLLHAAEGTVGLALAAEKMPDVILLDLHLPDISGEDVLRLLWNDRVLRGIPVIVLSADATPAQMRRLLAAGASAYLTKPLELSRVLETLDRMIALRAAPAVAHGEGT